MTEASKTSSASTKSRLISENKKDDAHRREIHFYIKLSLPAVEYMNDEWNIC